MYHIIDIKCIRSLFFLHFFFFFFAAVFSLSSPLCGVLLELGTSHQLVVVVVLVMTEAHDSPGSQDGQLDLCQWAQRSWIYPLYPLYVFHT